MGGLVGRADADPGRMRGFFDAKALSKDAVHEQGSTARAQTACLCRFIRGSWGLGWLRNTYLPEMPRMNNLPRDHN